jgi:hypothetical protein
MAHILLKNGRMVDLSALVLDGRPARTVGRDELEVRLRDLGVPVKVGQGRDSMLELYATYLTNWGLGNGSEPKHERR